MLIQPARLIQLAQLALLTPLTASTCRHLAAFIPRHAYLCKYQRRRARLDPTVFCRGLAQWTNSVRCLRADDNVTGQHACQRRMR